MAKPKILVVDDEQDIRELVELNLSRGGYEMILCESGQEALDPIATRRIEDLIEQLKDIYTIVIVTHNMQQAGRVSERAAFFCLGELIEYDKTAKIFSNPSQQ